MDQLYLFGNESPSAPLADRLRPDTLDGYVGQEHLVGEGRVLRRMIESDNVPSMIFWGPPGVGKTTLARIIAKHTHSDYVELSAVTSGVKEIKDIMNRAEMKRQTGIRTILFIDEVHRFNKAQQDAFLPYVERGSIILVGATTENPSFELNSALLSRCKVFILKELSEENIRTMILRALQSKEGFGDSDIRITDDQIDFIARFANGDARTALNTLEMAVLNAVPNADGSLTIEDETLAQCTNRRSLLYDKNGEEHYNIISALHKSMRNSDPDAAVYWMERMLYGGEDPLYIARRLVRFASEDVGLADSNALLIANAAFQACRYLGVPECNVHLAHAVVYLSLAPKSNSLEVATQQAESDIRKMPAEPVPLHIRNAPTKLMKENGYGKGYIYAHDTEEKMAKMTCLPDSLNGRRYYLPTDQGKEKQFKERLEQILEWKKS
ncbi:MAG: replication-associated recombination protein A [Clostridia bacterium]|nr:replication-associated recombination protein A [Clostridia bacterium]